MTIFEDYYTMGDRTEVMYEFHCNQTTLLLKLHIEEFRTYGEQSFETLLQHYGVPKATVTPNG